MRKLEPGQRVRVIACTGHAHKVETCPFVGKEAIAIDDLGANQWEGDPDHYYDTFVVGEWGRKWFPLRDLEIIE